MIHGDCVEVMDTLQGKYDCVIADPPYITGVTSDLRGKLNPWVDMMNAFYFYKEWMDKAKSRLKNSGSMWIFGNMYTFAPVQKAAYAIGLKVNDVIVWNKHLKGVGPKYRLRGAYEFIFLVGMPEFVIEDRSIINIWDVPTNTYKPSGHTAEKTPLIMEKIVLLATEKGGKILDPFAGSASAGEAAIVNGRSYTGIEESPYWVEYGQNRLDLITSGLSLPEVSGLAA